MVDLVHDFKFSRFGQVIAAFRAGGFNTLVSTCVGEEGLDIGDVDLIVCYDVSKSPISLVRTDSRAATGGLAESDSVQLSMASIAYLVLMALVN